MPGVLLDDPVDVDSLLTTQKMYTLSPMHVITARTDQMENPRGSKAHFVDKLLGDTQMEIRLTDSSHYLLAGGMC